jgi:small subunit ribosomal protein S8
MSMTDPIGAMLTRIRNAVRVRRDAVDVNASGVVRAIAKVLAREGFVSDVRDGEAGPHPTLRIYLKYDDDGQPVISSIGRVSRPGRRAYARVDEIPKVLNGLGIAVVSTSRGVLSDREARAQRVGGEVLCEVW